ncbi:MAG TPA: ABC transporter substrate-binding protein [Chloroflexota bacterium]|nr:ABC transporter substrate-binding protein [Chloroflexota bacterium]
MPAFGEKVVVFGPAYPMNLTPLWVAYDKGVFREEGLDVELAAVLGVPDSQHPRFQWRKEGKVVFSSPGGSPPFRSMRENRDPTDFEVNVVSIADRTAHVFVARADIEDPSQLRGKRLGADAKGGSSIDARIALRHFGLDPVNDLTWVDSRGQPPDTERYRLELFQKGELDAVCCDPPHWNIAVRMGGRRLTSSRDLFTLPEAGLSTTPVVIAEKPDLVRAMVRATLRGAEFARLNKEETLDCILRHNIHITRDLADVAWEEDHHDWGPVLEMAAYQRKVDIYTREWDLPAQPVSTYYNFEFLKQALEELKLLRAWDAAMDPAPVALAGALRP